LTVRLKIAAQASIQRPDRLEDGSWRPMEKVISRMGGRHDDQPYRRATEAGNGVLK